MNAPARKWTPDPEEGDVLDHALDGILDGAELETWLPANTGDLSGTAALTDAAALISAASSEAYSLSPRSSAPPDGIDFGAFQSAPPRTVPEPAPALKTVPCAEDVPRDAFDDDEPTRVNPPEKSKTPDGDSGADEDGWVEERVTILDPKLGQALTEDLRMSRSVPPPAPKEAVVLQTVVETAGPSETQSNDARKARRFDLSAQVVRVAIELDEGSARGRIRNLSVTGGVLIETRQPFPFRTDVRVDLTLSTGQSMTFSGRVVRKPTDNNMAVKLETHSVGRRFLGRFIYETLELGNVADIPMSIRRLKASRDEAGPDFHEIQLSHAWHEVLEQFDHEDAHQTFINRCMSARKMEFALEKYRELKAERPDDEAIDQRLAQIGTILGFVALQRSTKDEKEPSRLSGPLKIIGMVFGALVLLFIALTFLR